MRRLSSTVLPGLLALSALALAAPPAPAASTSARPHHKHGAKRSRRCKRHKVALKVGRRRVCAKPKVKAAALRQPRTPAAALKTATRALGAIRFSGPRAAQSRRAVRHLLASRGMRDLTLLARRTHLSSPRRRLLLGASASGGPLATASRPSTVQLPGGWLGEVTVDAASEEFTLGASKNGEGSSMTMRLPKSRLERCPDADGETEVRGGFTFALDSIADAGKHDGSQAFIHYALRETSKSKGHTGDDAHLHDIDFTAGAYQHAQVGLKDKSGKVLTTNPPFLATIKASGHYTAPFSLIEALKKALSEKGTAAAKPLLRSLLGEWDRNAGGTSYVISDGAWDAMGATAVSAPLAWSFVDLISTHDALVREQDAHWLVDCLKVNAESASADELAAGSTAPFFVSVARSQGGKAGTANITAEADVGKVSPPSAKGGERPIRLDYTAPSSGWKYGHVTLHAVSKQGAGKGSIEFKAPYGTYSVRFSVALDRQFLGGDDGVGSATWRGSAETLLVGDPSSGEAQIGAAATPFGWSSFALLREDEPMVCQAGGYGHVDTVGTGSDAGSFEVPGASVDGSAAEDEVTIRFVSPLDHYTDTFYPDATSCGEFSTSSAFRYFDYYRSRLGSEPGVEVHHPGGGDLAAQTYTITDWQQGTGQVEALRNFGWSEGEGTTEKLSGAISIEIIRLPPG
jgi:hypothetical protein